MAPTRELASQIHLEAKKLCFDSNLQTSCVYGGVKARAQLSELAGGIDILVATPGNATAMPTVLPVLRTGGRWNALRALKQLVSLRKSIEAMAVFVFKVLRDFRNDTNCLRAFVFANTTAASIRLAV